MVLVGVILMTELEIFGSYLGGSGTGGQIEDLKSGLDGFAGHWEREGCVELKLDDRLEGSFHFIWLWDLSLNGIAAYFKSIIMATVHSCRVGEVEAKFVLILCQLVRVNTGTQSHL